MAKQAGRFESCYGGSCAVLRPWKAAARLLKVSQACPKRATRQLRSPIETALSIGRRHGKASGTLRELLRRVVRC